MNKMAGVFAAVLSLTTLPALSQAQSLADSLDQQVQILTSHQSDAGAFFPTSCVNKNMDHLCYQEKSAFVTSLILESLLETHSPKIESLKQKSLAYLQSQLPDDGIITYFDKTSKLAFTAPPDTDDNAIFYGTLRKANVVPAGQIKSLDAVLQGALIDTTIKELHGPQTVTGKYFSTWIHHSKPFFSDIDLVVNANALFGFWNIAKDTHTYQNELSAVCSTVNTIINWSKDDSSTELNSVRHWFLRKSENYSQWYPYQYELFFSTVRAYLAAGRPACLEASYQKIKSDLLNRTQYGENIYEQAFGTAALKRILVADQEDLSPLLEPATLLTNALTANHFGSKDFFYYGEFGYIGSIDMVRTLAVEVLASLAPAARAPSSVDAPYSSPFDLVTYLNHEQMSDGSFTKMIIPSSILYNTYMILLYEYLGKTEEKAALISQLKEYIFTQQNADGSFSGYEGGLDNSSMSVLAYVTAKIAGENETSARMLKLESAIQNLGGVKKIDAKAFPMLSLFNLTTTDRYFKSGITSLLMDLDHELPWFKVLIYPLSYLYESKNIHTLSDQKFPGKIFTRLPAPPVPQKISAESRFFSWAMGRMNEDGTFFDYTPTTVPMLMALHAGGADYDATVEKGVAALESFQLSRPSSSGAPSLLQSPGEASIGETFYLANAMLDMGYSADHPVVKKAEQFLLDCQQKETGAWGFSKHNIHFPDTDDTSNVMFLLQRLHHLRGNSGMRAELTPALQWLLAQQNRDGGFGTWQKTAEILGPAFNLIGRKAGIVVDESVMEHSSRIILNLANLGQFDSNAKRAHDRALHWLLKNQNANGSFSGTWFVDYIFGTTMALNALNAEANPSEEVKTAATRALQFILAHQQADGGFGESPDSFVAGKTVELKTASPSQTGMIGALLITSLRLNQCRDYSQLQAPLQKMQAYLQAARNPTTELWDDSTWTAVTFPKFEYLIYVYIQTLAPEQASVMSQNPCNAVGL